MALTRLGDIASHGGIDLTGDSAARTVDGQRLAVPGMRLTGTQRGEHGIEFRYDSGDRQFGDCQSEARLAFPEQADPVRRPQGRQVPRGFRGGFPGE